MAVNNGRLERSRTISYARCITTWLSGLPYNQHPPLGRALAQAPPPPQPIMKPLPVASLIKFNSRHRDPRQISFYGTFKSHFGFSALAKRASSTNTLSLSLTNKLLACPAPHFQQRVSLRHIHLHNTDISIMTDQRPDLASNRHQLADWLAVSSDRVVSVEHPSIIKDIDKGLHSLGGEHHIKHVGQGHFFISLAMSSDRLVMIAACSCGSNIICRPISTPT